MVHNRKKIKKNSFGLLLSIMFVVFSCDNSTSVTETPVKVKTVNPKDVSVWIFVAPYLLNAGTRDDSGEKYYVKALVRGLTDSSKIDYSKTKVLINDLVQVSYAGLSKTSDSYVFTSKSDEYIVLYERDSVVISIENSAFGRVYIRGILPDYVHTLTFSPSFDTTVINTQSQYTVSWPKTSKGELFYNYWDENNKTFLHGIPSESNTFELDLNDDFGSIVGYFGLDCYTQCSFTSANQDSMSITLTINSPTFFSIKNFE